MRRFGLALAVLVTACGSSDGSPFGGGGGGGSSAGGVDAGVSGGSTSASGGSPSSGGVTTSSGGTQQAGGTGSGGTTTGTGGTLDLDASPGGTGGSDPDASTGGESSSGGGVGSTGGSTGSGGMTNTGGSGSGGVVSTGGATSTGGGSATGGSTGTGGATNSGGSSSAGGTSSTGGSTGGGGTTSTGGSIGTGGTSSTGGAASTGGTTSDAGPGDAGPQDPKVGDLCQGTVSACFNDNWLVCGPLGKLILNDICNFGCNPEGSYANVDCRKYQGQNLSVTNDVIRWTDATNSWALVHPTTGAETTSPCNSQGAFHLATFTEMLKVRDTTTDSTASVVDGFSWFEKFVVGSTLLNVATSTPMPQQLGAYLGMQFPGGQKVSYTPDQTIFPGAYYLCVK